MGFWNVSRVSSTPLHAIMRNRVLGKQGEELVWQNEIERLREAGRSDLARKVRWVSQEEGDGAGYDVLSFTESGKERYLEVKTTIGDARTPFFVSRNEKEFSEERRDGFRIFRLIEFGRETKDIPHQAAAGGTRDP